jgi:hypothetical protein
VSSPQSKPVLRLDWCSYVAAKYAVEHWHYSKNMPHGKQQTIGVWEGGRFIGAVVIGRSISPHIGTTYGLSQFQCAEVTRVAISRHVASVSRIISIAIGLLRCANSGLRLLLSFADSAHGHHGGIYQAANWIYVGESRVTQYKVNGRWRNDTHVNRWQGRVGCIHRESSPKYKYLMPLDPAMRAQIAPLAKPYPKRPCATSIDSDVSGDQPEEGGASPTVALHKADMGLSPRLATELLAPSPTRWIA